MEIDPTFSAKINFIKTENYFIFENVQKIEPNDKAFKHF
jgi:hypothetical protein